MDRASGLATMALAPTGTYYVFELVDEHWARALGCFSFFLLMSMAVLRRTKIDKTRWRARVGEDTITIDYIEACIEEEQAKRVLDHPSVNRQALESSIRDIDGLDKKSTEWREPTIPAPLIAILFSLGTALLQRTTDRLVQQGRLPDVVGGLAVGILSVVLIGVGHAQVSGFLLGRRRRRRVFYRALVGARFFVENGRQPAPWLKSCGGSVVSIPIPSKAGRVKQRKGPRGKR